MARIAVTRERREDETRVAVTPETVKKLAGSGFCKVSWRRNCIFDDTTNRESSGIRRDRAIGTD